MQSMKIGEAKKIADEKRAKALELTDEMLTAFLRMNATIVSR